MLFFFPNHLQVSEIMSRFSLLDYFRWLSSGWGLRFSLHHKVSSTLPPPADAFLSVADLVPARLCAWWIYGDVLSVSLVGEVLPARWINDDLLSVFPVREILPARWINGDHLSVFPAREILFASWINGNLLSEFLVREVLPAWWVN